MWALCAILTQVVDDLPVAIRTDGEKLKLLENTEWFRIPYPFQWGLPTVSPEGVLGMMAGVLASAIESVGDYYACARLSGAPPPPPHAINRGIGTEGLGCILAGMWGSGNGTTGYSENIGAIGVTGVGSRRVIQWAAAIMILFGVLSKLSALMVTIPNPIIGESSPSCSASSLPLASPTSSSSTSTPREICSSLASPYSSHWCCLSGWQHSRRQASPQSTPAAPPSTRSSLS